MKKKVRRFFTGEEDNLPIDDDDGNNIIVTFQTDSKNKTDITDLDSWLSYERETYQGNGYGYESRSVTSLEENIEKKQSTGSNVEFPLDLKTKTNRYRIL